MGAGAGYRDNLEGGQYGEEEQTAVLTCCLLSSLEELAINGKTGTKMCSCRVKLTEYKLNWSVFIYMNEQIIQNDLMRNYNVFSLVSGWSTIALPMLAFLYCFAQVGLERTSLPPWVTLTVYKSENPCRRTTKAPCWLQSCSNRRLTWLTATPVCPNMTEVQLLSTACRAAQNLCGVFTECDEIRGAVFLSNFHKAALSASHETVKRKVGPWIRLHYIALISYCSVVQ